MSSSRIFICSDSCLNIGKGSRGPGTQILEFQTLLESKGIYIDGPDLQIQNGAKSHELADSILLKISNIEGWGQEQLSRYKNGPLTMPMYQGKTRGMVHVQ